MMSLHTGSLAFAGWPSNVTQITNATIMPRKAMLVVLVPSPAPP
jgi:hypothetical protein